MFRNVFSARHGVAAMAIALTLSTTAALAQDATMMSRDDVLKDVTATFGGVPSFVTTMPDSVIGGAWLLERDLEVSDKTALDAKTKALISLAVASQIPCMYCIWADTNTLKQLGATDAEIHEAVAMAGLTRFYSTWFNGTQVDFEQFKKELGGPAQ